MPIFFRLPALYALLSAWVLLAACNAYAGDLIADRAFFVDDTASKTLAEVRQAPLTPYAGVLSRGYTKAAIWVRLGITPPGNSRPDDEVVLRIRPVFLDEIRLFDPLDTSGAVRMAGDTMPFSASEFPSLSHTFVIPAGAEPRSIWLRVRSTSTTLLTVEAMTRPEMSTSELNLNVAYFLALAVIAMFVLLVIINWPGHREILYPLFVIRQVFYLIYTASLFGLHRLLLKDFSPPFLDALYSWIVVGSTAIAVLFEREFLSEYSPRLPTKLALNGLLCWSALAIAMLLFGDVGQALKANMMLNAVAVLTFLLIALTSAGRHERDEKHNELLLSKKVIVGYYSALSLVLFFSVLPLLGLLNANKYAIDGFVFYALASSLIVTAMMLVRAHKQRRIHAEYGNKLLLSEQRVALEKSKREEQSHLFHMLMHEIKNPLAVIDMALLAKNDQKTTSAYVSRAINSVKDILDRCVKADKLSDGNVDTDLESVPLNEFVNQLLAKKNGEARHFSVRIDDAFTVIADRQLFGVVMNNLVDNALRYGDLREPVGIDARAAANHAGVRGIAITVSNRPGPASWPDPDKVFKKYYRSAGAEAQSGTGLGLYLIRTLATLMDGECHYVPDDKNIRFELWLPT